MRAACSVRGESKVFLLRNLSKSYTTPLGNPRHSALGAILPNDDAYSAHHICIGFHAKVPRLTWRRRRRRRQRANVVKLAANSISFPLAQSYSTSAVPISSSSSSSIRLLFASLSINENCQSVANERGDSNTHIYCYWWKMASFLFFKKEGRDAVGRDLLYT